MLESKSKYTIRWVILPIAEPFGPLVKPVAAACNAHIVIAKTDPSELYTFTNGRASLVSARIGELKTPTMVTMGESVLIFNFGDVWTFNPMQQKLTQVVYTGEFPKRRGMTGAVSDRTVYLFGGKSDFHAKSRMFFDDLIIYDMRNSTVTVRSGIPNTPSKRWHAASLVIHQNLYLFGGSSDHHSNGDLWVLDLQKMQWRLITADLPPRKCATLIQLGSFIGVFGGGSSHPVSSGSRSSRSSETGASGPTTSGGMFLIDIQTGRQVDTQEFGNINDVQYSATVVGIDGIITFTGGRDQKTGQTMILRLELPENLQPKQHLIPDVIQGAVSDVPVITARTRSATKRHQSQSGVFPFDKPVGEHERIGSIAFHDVPPLDRFVDSDEIPESSQEPGTKKKRSRTETRKSAPPVFSDELHGPAAEELAGASSDESPVQEGPRVQVTAPGQPRTAEKLASEPPEEQPEIPVLSKAPEAATAAAKPPRRHSFSKSPAHAAKDLETLEKPAPDAKHSRRHSSSKTPETPAATGKDPETPSASQTPEEPAPGTEVPEEPASLKGSEEPVPFPKVSEKPAPSKSSDEPAPSSKAPEMTWLPFRGANLAIVSFDAKNHTESTTADLSQIFAIPS
jgi:hypothetical protein